MIFTIIWLIGSIVAYVLIRKFDGPSKNYDLVFFKVFICLLFSWLLAFAIFIVRMTSKPPKWL